MKKQSLEGALACVGAVIGAGFVSGREVISFFTRYGMHSWWLIFISASVMLLLCALCMRRAVLLCHGNWCDLYQNEHSAVRFATELCVTLLLIIIGGAMISAAGHMVMLLWPSDWAYAVGTVGTLGVAWLLSKGSMKPLSWISSVLTLVFFVGIMLILNKDRVSQTVVLDRQTAPGDLWWAALRAVAYAAMNLSIAIGVVCKVCVSCRRRNDRQSTVFGLLLIFLLFISNYLYLKHPELWGEAFPVVKLFASFGRVGFVLSVTLLYMAISSTLIAVICALRSAMTCRIHYQPLACILTLGCPLAVSAVGFMSIVDGLYAPVGMLCLCMVFVPLLWSKRRSRRYHEKAGQERADQSEKT